MPLLLILLLLVLTWFLCIGIQSNCEVLSDPNTTPGYRLLFTLLQILAVFCMFGMIYAYGWLLTLLWSA